MEIKRQAFAAPTPVLEDVNGDAGREATAAPESIAPASGADTAAQALFDAARDLQQAQARRYEAHAQAIRHTAQALEMAGETGGVDNGRLDSLLDSLAGAALSEKLDKPRERAVGVRFLSLSLSREAEAGQAGDTGQPAVAPYIYNRALPASGSAANGASGNNLDDIWKELAEMIGKSEEGDLGDYAAALDKYTKLYQALSDILGQFGKWVRADDDNHMRVDFGSLQNALNSLLNKYWNPTQNEVIAGKAPRGGISGKEAAAICERLGLDPKECSHRNSDGTYCVVPDTSQVKRMIEGLPATSNNRRISIASYNAWKAGFDSQMSRVEDALQMRGQKYSNSYSRFENFHKTISSIIQSMADMLRQYLQF